MQVQKFIETQQKTNKSLNRELRKSRGYRNPYFLRSTVESFKLQEGGTCFAPEVGFGLLLHDGYHACCGAPATMLSCIGRWQWGCQVQGGISPLHDMLLPGCRYGIPLPCPRRTTRKLLQLSGTSLTVSARPGASSRGLSSSQGGLRLRGLAQLACRGLVQQWPCKRWQSWQLKI